MIITADGHDVWTMTLLADAPWPIRTVAEVTGVLMLI